MCACCIERCFIFVFVWDLCFSKLCCLYVDYMSLACCMLHILDEFVAHLNEAMLVLHAHDRNASAILGYMGSGCLCRCCGWGCCAGWIMHVLVLHVA